MGFVFFKLYAYGSIFLPTIKLNFQIILPYQVIFICDLEALFKGTKIPEKLKYSISDEKISGKIISISP